MNLKERLKKRRKETEVKWEIIEQDYLLSLIIESIALVPELKNNVVFKGGTALKKMYFGDYRFSQDLDFSVVAEHDYLSAHLGELMKVVCTLATERRQAISNENIIIESAPYFGDRPHPRGQLAFCIQVKYPWHRSFYTKVYAEFTFQELVVSEPLLKSIIHDYGDPCEGELYVYSLEEIVAEKIRALLEFAKKLHERGWGRSRVRDYFDIWMILTTFVDSIDLTIIPDIVKKKCEYKNVVFQGIDDIFQQALLLNVESEWEVWLSGLVTMLPDKSKVIKELREILIPIFQEHVHVVEPSDANEKHV